MRSPWRTTAWSSAIRTRIIAGTSSATVVPAPGRESILSAPPSARARSSIEVSPSRRERSAGLVGVEADAVVVDRHAQVPVAASSRTSMRLARGVAQRVLQRLLGDAEDLAARPARGSASPSTLERDRVAVHAPQDVDVLAQRRGQALVSARGRAQLEDQRAQLLHRLARELLQAPQLGPGLGGVAVEHGAPPPRRRA